MSVDPETILPPEDEPRPKAISFNGPQPEEARVRLAGVSMQGVSHLQKGSPCQDRHRWAILPDGGFVLAVADGAGSATRSEEGAEIAVRTALRTVESSTEDVESTLRQAFADAQAAIVAAAAEAEATPRDFACTLALCWVRDDTINVASVGDCMVFALDHDGEAHLVSALERGEHVNTTVFVTADNALEKLDVRSVEMAWSLISVQSDGMQWVSLNLQSLRVNSALYRSVAAQLRSHESADDDVVFLRGFLENLYENSGRKCDDDLTLACAVRLPAE